MSAASGELPYVSLRFLKKHPFGVCLLFLLAQKILADCHTNNVMGDSRNFVDYFFSLS